MAVGVLGGTPMVITCCVCREVVHTSNGYILEHGVYIHGVFHVCSGSGSPASPFVSCSSCG